MQVQVRINEEGMLRNQRYAFTDKFTLISELMQNTRRAGASRIEIEYDEKFKILRVIDDGCGIADFQKLLTFNESGWNAATCIEERPFGIGFSKCLYSASRCIVESCGRKIDFSTDDALSRHPIDVHQVEHLLGTRVELHDVVLPGLTDRLTTMCEGFTIPVWFNGRELQRPFAIDCMPFVTTAIGHVHLAGTRNGKHASNMLVFLQGFCVMKPIYYQVDSINVVHLDSKEFVARLPDRDKLIDENDQRKRIDACLKALWREILLAAKATMTPESFVATYYEAMRSWWQLDLLNDVPILPTALCQRIVGYPIQELYENIDYVETVKVALSRREIEDGSVKLVDLDYVNDSNAAHWMFAKAQGYIVFSSISLNDNHWVQPYVRQLEEESTSVAAIGEQCRAELEGRFIWPQVILCDTVAITVGGDHVDISEDGVYHDDVLFIPSGECSGEPVRQASSFIDDVDQFQESDLNADRDALVDLTLRLRSVDPQATLESLLHELKLERYPLLHGRTFQLSVGHNRNDHSVELVS